jgi:hypothetical protein
MPSMTGIRMSMMITSGRSDGQLDRLLTRSGDADEIQGHVSAATRALIAARPWLRVCTLRAYAPEFNPVEKVWFHSIAAWQPRRRHRHQLRPPGQDQAQEDAVR